MQSLRSEEYATLRQEILQLQTTIATYNVYMYSICIVVLSLSITETPYLSLLVYLTVCVFQCKIISASEGTIRIAAYICCSFLKNNNNPNDFFWESHRVAINNYLWEQTQFHKKHKFISRISFSSGLVISLVPVIICLETLIKSCSHISIGAFTLSIFGLIISFYLNQTLIQIGEDGFNSYRNKLKGFMKE